MFVETRTHCTNDDRRNSKRNFFLYIKKPEMKYNPHTVNETRRKKSPENQGKRTEMSTEWKFERHIHTLQTARICREK